MNLVHHSAGLLLLGLVLYTVVSCESKEKYTPPSDALVVSGARYIMPSDLAFRLRFTPHQPLRGMSEGERRKTYLQPMIDELVMARATGDLRLDTSQIYQLQLREMKKDIIREALYFNEVEAETDIPGEELREAVRRSKQERLLRYMTFDTRPEAEHARDLLNRDSLNFDQVFQQYYQAGLSPPSLEIRWGQLKPDVEDVVYSLEPGDITPIIPAEDGYLLLQLEGITDVTPRDTEGYEKLLRQVRQNLRDRVLDATSRKYILEIMKSVDINVNREGVNALVRYLRDNFHDHPGDSILTLKSQREMPRYPETEEQTSKHLVVFDGTQWTVRNFLNIAGARGLKLPKEEKYYPAWVKDKLGILIRDEVLTQQGIELGLDTTESVRQRTNRWENYYRAQLYKEKVLKIPPQPDSTISTTARSKLDSLRQIYPVSIDEKRLSAVPIEEMQMIALKHGSFSHLAVPPYPQYLLDIHIRAQNSQE